MMSMSDLTHYTADFISTPALTGVVLFPALCTLYLAMYVNLAGSGSMMTKKIFEFKKNGCMCNKITEQWNGHQK